MTASEPTRLADLVEHGQSSSNPTGGQSITPQEHGSGEGAMVENGEGTDSRPRDGTKSVRTAIEGSETKAVVMDNSVGLVPSGQAQPGPSIHTVSAGSIEAVRARVSEETASIHRRFTHGLLR